MRMALFILSVISLLSGIYFLLIELLKIYTSLGQLIYVSLLVVLLCLSVAGIAVALPKIFIKDRQ